MVALVQKNFKIRIFQLHSLKDYRMNAEKYAKFSVGNLSNFPFLSSLKLFSERFFSFVKFSGTEETLAL